MRFTILQSLTDPTAPTHEIGWPELVGSLTKPPTYASKYQCPLIKLAVFGNVKSPKGMLRNDQNVTSVTGIELDYDGEVVPLPEAAQRLERAGLEALLYTSASNEPDRPRWRALLPLSVEYPPEYRRSLVEAANAVLGGICAVESATLSQAFFIGAVEGTPYEATHVSGQPIDLVHTPVPQPLRQSVQRETPEFRPVPLDPLPIPDAIKALIRNGPIDGEPRHAALMTAANALARARIHPDDITRILADPDNLISQKAHEGRDLEGAMYWLKRHTIAKALELFPSPDIAFANPLPTTRTDPQSLLTDATDLTNNPAPIRWLIRGVLEQGVFGTLFGQSGAGKSVTAIDMAMCIATGKPWRGHAIAHPGPVVYVSGEGHGGFPRRLKAWMTENETAPAPGRFFLTRRNVMFRDPQQLGGFLNELDAMPVKPVLVILDTLDRINAGGNENDTQDMAIFIRYCEQIKERYGCTVIVLHHTSNADPMRARGANNLKGACDVELALMHTTQPGVSKLACAKMKDAERFEDRYFRFKYIPIMWFDPDTKEQLRSVVFEDADAPQSDVPQGQKIFAMALGTEPIDYQKVREVFVQLYGTGQPASRRKAFDRAFDKAKERQWFSQKGDTLIPQPPALKRDGVLD